MRVRSEKRRLALIKKIAKKHGIWVAKKTRTVKAIKINKDVDSYNINAYTDASKYADTFYGDRMRDQKSYEADWN